MIDKVFLITGNKISAFIADEESLKFSSSTSDTNINNFRESFAKKLSLSKKIEIKYDSIKSIKKEDNDDDILIKYKSFAGMPGNCEFSFSNKNDQDTFFTYLEKERYFTKTKETLTPFKAIINYLIGLIVTIGLTVFSYFQALQIANGTADQITSRKGRVYQNIVSMLGDKGVILVGTAISVFLIYKIWTRFKNPPTQVKLIPPNS